MGSKKISRKNGDGEDIKRCLDEIANAGIHYRVKRTTKGTVLTVATTRSGLRNGPTRLVTCRDDVTRMIASAALSFE